MDEEQGLYGKYKVVKTNGEALDPNAIYFTLRIDTDKHARAAIRAYIESCKYEQPELAEDLEKVMKEVGE